jgi:hypothetical protein
MGRLVADEGHLLRRRSADEEDRGRALAGAGRRDEHPAFVLLGLVLIGDDGEAELFGELGDGVVITADDEGDVARDWDMHVRCTGLHGSSK